MKPKTNTTKSIRLGVATLALTLISTAMIGCGSNQQDEILGMWGQKDPATGVLAQVIQVNQGAARPASHSNEKEEDMVNLVQIYGNELTTDTMHINLSYDRFTTKMPVTLILQDNDTWKPEVRDIVLYLDDKLAEAGKKSVDAGYGVYDKNSDRNKLSQMETKLNEEFKQVQIVVNGDILAWGREDGTEAPQEWFRIASSEEKDALIAKASQYFEDQKIAAVEAQEKHDEAVKTMNPIQVEVEAYKFLMKQNIFSYYYNASDKCRAISRGFRKFKDDAGMKFIAFKETYLTLREGNYEKEKALDEALALIGLDRDGNIVENDSQ